MLAQRRLSRLASPSLLAASLMMMAAACGKGDGTDATPTATPTFSAKPPPERPLQERDLEKVCGEAAEARAKPYDAKAPGIHPLVIFARDSDAEQYHASNISMLDEWTAEKATDYELVACVTKKSRNKVKECVFDDKKPTRYLEIYEATYDIAIHEASTGKKIASKTVALGPSIVGCPTMWMFNKEREASDPRFTYPLINLAKPLVMPGDLTAEALVASAKPTANAKTGRKLLKSDLPKVCSEIPERRTAAYEKKPGEAHPLLVVHRTGEDAEFLTSYSSAFKDVDAKEPEEYQLVACVTEKSRTKVRECAFDEKKPVRYVDMYDATFEVSVLEARTGKKLTSKTLPIKAEKRCPSFWMFRGDRDVDVPSFDKAVLRLVTPFTSPK
jgi:hypothetical protein